MTVGDSIGVGVRQTDVDEAGRADLLKAIEAAIDSDRENGDLRAFVRAFYRHAPLETLLEQPAEQLMSAARALWKFAAHRTPGQAKVRVYNPRQEAHGWQLNRTVVEIVNDDMPFLVDSVTAALNRLNARVVRVIHPVVPVVRESDGRLLRLREERVSGEWRPESIMQVRVRRQAVSRHGQIEAAVDSVLRDVRAAVSDWSTMRRLGWQIVDELERQPPPLDRAEIDEAIAFLRWLDDDHFTFLGSREYRFVGDEESAVGHLVPDSGLGILADSSKVVFEGMRHLSRLPVEVRDFVRQPELLRVTKSSVMSTVHRRAYLDVVSVKALDGEGGVTGERIFAGLFTSSAYSQRVMDIPFLRRKARAVIDHFGFAPQSHNGKVLVHLLETHPRDELFQISADELGGQLRGILDLQQTQRIALFVRHDPFERFVSCLIYVPRERFDTHLRRRFERILEQAFGGEVITYFLLLTEQPMARLHVIVRTTPGHLPKVDIEKLEAELRTAGRSWQQDLESALLERLGEEEALPVVRRYRPAFQVGYQAQTTPAEAVEDIEAIDHLLGGEAVALRLFRRADERDDRVNLKILTPGPLAPLSDVLPMVERMGLSVLYERAHEVELEEHVVWIRRRCSRPDHNSDSVAVS